MLFEDMTFKEAFNKTGRILNVTVTSKHQNAGQILLNHLTVPDVTLWSAGNSLIFIISILKMI
jgi:TAG lipase / steryl ester hydrolase / phospholipase A2 / LPA acyltransferase